MFTGLVESIASVKSLSNEHGFVRLVVQVSQELSTLKLGDSIAVNGVCLTIVDMSKNELAVDIVAETLSRTNLSSLEEGMSVNFEKAAVLGQSMGGHIVQGHVDTTCEIKNIEPDGDSRKIFFSLPTEYTKFLVSKGSVTLDGISITLVDVEEDLFSVVLIPYTLSQTISMHYQVGQRVNLEIDVMAKQICKMVESYHDKLKATN